MDENSLYIFNLICLSNTEFELDVCKCAAELYLERHRGKEFFKMYLFLLQLIDKKITTNKLWEKQ